MFRLFRKRRSPSECAVALGAEFAAFEAEWPDLRPAFEVAKERDGNALTLAISTMCQEEAKLADMTFLALAAYQAGFAAGGRAALTGRIAPKHTRETRELPTRATGHGGVANEDEGQMNEFFDRMRHAEQRWLGFEEALQAAAQFDMPSIKEGTEGLAKKPHRAQAEMVMFMAYRSGYAAGADAGALQL